MGRVRKWLHKQTSKISTFWRGILRTTGILFGIHQPGNDSYEFGQVLIAVGAFLVGTPFLIMFLGEMFNPVIWLTIVIGSLWLVNLDQALYTVSTMVDYGVDNKEPGLI
jgi:hypothetical protein